MSAGVLLQALIAGLAQGARSHHRVGIHDRGLVTALARSLALALVLTGCSVSLTGTPAARVSPSPPVAPSAPLPSPSASAEGRPPRGTPPPQTQLAAVRAGTAIVLLEAATGEVRSIHQLPAGRRSEHLAWAPGGGRLALDATLVRCCSDIWTMTATGGDLVMLTAESPADILNSRPAWSPDGRRVAFTSVLADSPAKIWAVETDTRTRTRLTTGPEADADPFWTPDPGGLLFSRSAGPGQPYHLFRALPGGRPAPLTEGPASDRSPSLPAGGGRLLFTRQQPGSVPHVFSAAPDGGDLRQLTGEEGETDPAWSADGTRIAYIRGGAVWIMDADGGRKARLTAAGQFTSPAWRPVG